MTPGNFAAYSVTGTHQAVTTCLSLPRTRRRLDFREHHDHHDNQRQSHPDRHARLQWFRLPYDRQRQFGRVQHRHREHLQPDTQRCGPYDRRRGGRLLPDLPRERALPGDDCELGDGRGGFSADRARQGAPDRGDCSGCHTTTPTFATDQTGSSTKPANHIPTNAPCAQCHTTAGNYATYSVTGTHQGVTSCLSCHAPAVATTFANITIVTTSANHIPIGALDCSAQVATRPRNVNPGGFSIGAANISAPTLTTTGHTTVATVVASCQTCHESAPYQGMLASTSTAAGDSRPTALDKSHPTTGDCGGCHTTTPTFAGNVTSGSKPTNHIPTNAPCAQCHTTAGNYAAYVMGTHGAYGNHQQLRPMPC